MFLQFKKFILASPAAVRVNVRLDIKDAKTGALRRCHRGHNLVTDSGLAALAAGMAGGSTTVDGFRVGSGTTPAAAGDTALETPVATLPITLVGSAGAVFTAQQYIGSTAQNGETLTEAALYIGGTLLARFVYDDPDLQPKTGAVAAVFTWDITLSAV